MTAQYALLLAGAVLLLVTAVVLWRRGQRLHIRVAGITERLERTERAADDFTDAVSEVRSTAARVVRERRVELRKLRLERERLERSR